MLSETDLKKPYGYKIKIEILKKNYYLGVQSNCKAAVLYILYALYTGISLIVNMIQ